MDITKASATKLELLLVTAERAESDFCDTFIFRGRGHERMSEIRESAAKGHDPLAIDYCAALDRGNALRAERERRLRYHGNTKPIKNI